MRLNATPKLISDKRDTNTGTQRRKRTKPGALVKSVMEQNTAADVNVNSASNMDRLPHSGEVVGILSRNMKARKLTWEVNDVFFGLGVLNNCGLFQSRQSDFEISQFLSCVCQASFHADMLVVYF